MHVGRSVCTLFIIVAFVAILALATIVMSIRAIDLIQHPLVTLDDDVFGESLDDCDPFSLGPCF